MKAIKRECPTDGTCETGNAYSDDNNELQKSSLEKKYLSTRKVNIYSEPITHDSKISGN